MKSVIRDFIVGKNDQSIWLFECKECGKTCSTYECNRICICGGGFYCQHCEAINMNSSIKFIDKV